MKKLCFAVLTMAIVSCTTDSVEETEELSSVKLSAGTYSNVIGNNANTLIYRGNNKWSGNVGIGGHAYFYGATPQELDNGKSSAWTVTTPTGSSGYYSQYNAMVTGSGAGFTVTSSYSQITPLLPLFRVDYNDEGVGKAKATRYKFTKKTNLNTSVFRGKIILNSNCRPIIVDGSSIRPIGCLGSGPIDDSIIPD